MYVTLEINVIDTCCQRNQAEIKGLLTEKQPLSHWAINKLSYKMFFFKFSMMKSSWKVNYYVVDEKYIIMQTYIIIFTPELYFIGLYQFLVRIAKAKLIEISKKKIKEQQIKI